MSVWLLSVQGRLKESSIPYVPGNGSGFQREVEVFVTALKPSASHRFTLAGDKERGIKVVMLGTEDSSKTWKEGLDFEILSTSVGGGAK